MEVTADRRHLDLRPVSVAQLPAARGDATEGVVDVGAASDGAERHGRTAALGLLQREMHIPTGRLHASLMPTSQRPFHVAIPTGGLRVHAIEHGLVYVEIATGGAGSEGDDRLLDVDIAAGALHIELTEDARQV